MIIIFRVRLKCVLFRDAATMREKQKKAQDKKEAAEAGKK